MRKTWPREKRLDLLRAIFYAFSHEYEKRQHIAEGCLAAVLRNLIQRWPEIGYQFGQAPGLRYYSRQLQNDTDRLQENGEIGKSVGIPTYLSLGCLGMGRVKKAWESLEPNQQAEVRQLVAEELKTHQSPFNLTYARCPV